MSNYWKALQAINQVAGELGLPKTNSIAGDTSVQTTQLLALMNSAGNELLNYYPWEQFRKEWVFDTVGDQGEYALPVDWAYNLDQTQWDRTDHWPLIGPKSAQEWAWLKGGLLAAAPRLRFRVAGNKFMIWPVPDSDHAYNIAQEYISRYWVMPDSTQSSSDMIDLDSDIVLYDPWLFTRYVKLKFYQLKGFDQTAVQADFMRIFNALTGKDVGAPILNMSPRPVSQYLGPWSVPDGSWNLGQP